MIPKFRFFGRVADGEMRMVLAEAIDFKGGFVYYSYHDFTVEGDDNVFGDTISFENCVLMQSTGLKDKNGKEIFEGDIVETIYNEKLFTGVIVYDQKETDFKATNGRNEYGNNFRYLGGNDSIIVIGDIYQNQELLEEL